MEEIDTTNFNSEAGVVTKKPTGALFNKQRGTSAVNSIESKNIAFKEIIENDESCVNLNLEFIKSNNKI